MTLLTAAWGLGMIIGPMLGGMLSFPAKSFPLFDTPFFRRFPFSLPCFVVSGICAVVAVASYFVLPETLSRDSALARSDAVAKHLEASGGKAANHGMPTDGSVRAMFKAPTSRWTLVLYTVFSMATIGVEEMHSVFCATAITHGGLGWPSTSIGSSLAVMGFVLILAQPVVYPNLEHRFRIVGTFRLCAMAVICFTLLYPCVHELVVMPATARIVREGTRDSPAQGQSWLVWIGLLVAGCGFKVSASCCFTSMNLMLSNAAPSHLRGTINGLSMTLSMFARIFGPVIGGFLFSWSIAHPHPWPFNHHTCFIFFALVFLASMQVIRRLPSSINTQPD
jgi:hypothetical protein